jgi:ketosteroid isomerase-like protein
MRRLSWIPQLGLALLLVSSSTAWAEDEKSSVSSSEANKAVVRRAFAAFEQGDVATLNELFDPEGPWHSPTGTTIRQGGPHAELKSSCPMCASLAQRKILIDVIFAEGDLVAVRSTWSGIYTGSFRGTRVEGKKVSIIYSNIYRVVDGKIRENWADVDRLALAEQFGLQLGSAGASK